MKKVKSLNFLTFNIFLSTILLDENNLIFFGKFYKLPLLLKCPNLFFPPLSSFLLFFYNSSNLISSKFYNYSTIQNNNFFFKILMPCILIFNFLI